PLAALAALDEQRHQATARSALVDDEASHATDAELRDIGIELGGGDATLPAIGVALLVERRAPAERLLAGQLEEATDGSLVTQVERHRPEGGDRRDRGAVRELPAEVRRL